jgi:hypothetical protein
MSKKLLAMHVKGTEKEWSFHFYGDPRHLEDWRSDGLAVYQVENIIPAWAADLGLTRIWCFVQDIINFKNPLKGRRNAP